MATKTGFRVLILCLVVVAATVTAAAADFPVSLWVDGQAMAPDVPARVENGRMLVPVRFVAEALGAQVDWAPAPNGGGQVSILTYPRYFSSGTGPAVFQRSRPTDLNAIGAATVLTQFLASMQAETMTGTDPVLVRFELVDLADLCVYPPPDDLDEWCALGFEFAVRLYYVDFAENSAPAGVAQYGRFPQATGTTAYGGVAREVRGTWYDDVSYQVHPIGSDRLEGEGASTIVSYGTGGWRVDPGSRNLLRTVHLQRAPWVIHGSFGR